MIAPRFNFDDELMVVVMERAVSSLPNIDDANARALAYACVRVPDEFAAKHDSEALRRARIYRDRIKTGAA